MNAEQENKDREMLIRLQERVGFYLERQDKFITEILTRLTAIEEGKASEQVQKDHESRIRELEKVHNIESKPAKTSGGVPGPMSGDLPQIPDTSLLYTAKHEDFYSQIALQKSINR